LTTTIPDAVSIAAHAKINVFLRVLSRESSGFHGIETVFALLELADEIAVERTASGIDLEVEGGDTGPAEDNLALRAARAVIAATGDGFGVRIRLTKNIPVQAGLGGGSSDAAATLHAVNLLAGGVIPRHEILQFAADLGSDIPFFASGAAMAVAWNRGERLFRVPGPPEAPALLVIPAVGIATADAYALLDRLRGEPSPRGAVVLEPEALQTWGGLARLGGNDFESVVWEREPRIREVFERVAGTKPLLARMSGSGSAIVGIYRSEQDLEHAAMMIGTGGQRVVQTQTRSRPAPGPVAVTAADP
jgi:4-diphosphocytidyl-2-C-methyl-D-erythritol kinase